MLHKWLLVQVEKIGVEKVMRLMRILLVGEVLKGGIFGQRWLEEKLLL